MLNEFLKPQIESILSFCFRSESDDDGAATAKPRVHGVPDNVRRLRQAEEALQDGLAQVSCAQSVFLKL